MNTFEKSRFETERLIINRHYSIAKMKRTSYKQTALLQVTFVTTVLLFAFCNLIQKPAFTKVSAEEHNIAKFESNKQENDANFLVSAAEINLEEIHLGELARKNGRTTYIKELGKTIGAVHTKSLNDLTALAKSKMISIPTSLTYHAQETYKKLNEKSGHEFDKAYTDMMVSEHKVVISTFEKIATDGNDTDIKNWAKVTLPDFRTHLDFSIDCQKNYLRK